MFFKFRFGGLKAEETQNSQNLPYVIDLVLVLLLLTLNIFNTFYYCFYCWLWFFTVRGFEIYERISFVKKNMEES